MTTVRRLGSLNKNVLENCPGLPTEQESRTYRCNGPLIKSRKFNSSVCVVRFVCDTVSWRDTAASLESVQSNKVPFSKRRKVIIQYLILMDGYAAVTQTHH